MSSQTLLEINKLCISVNDKSILNDIDLSLNKGDVLGIIGESGSGKSMLALSIMGLLPEGFETTGSINFNQQNLLQASEAQLCNGSVFLQE